MERYIGQWEVEVKTPMGGEESPWDFYEKDGVLTGEVFLLGNSANLGEITLDGDNFSCSPDVMSPVGPMKVSITGTIDGTHITGVAKGGPIVMEFEGEKK